MGLAMIAMGSMIALSYFFGSQWLERAVLWWPLLLIMVGIEILIYLWQSKQDAPLVKFDLFSMFVVAFFGGTAILLALGQSSGIIEEFRKLTAEKTYMDITDHQQPVDASIKRIVVRGNGRMGPQVSVDKMKERSVEVFGNCLVSPGREGQKELDVTRMRQAGDTLYISLNQLKERGRFPVSSDYCYVTLVLPETIPVEMPGWLVRPIFEGELPKNWKLNDNL